MNFFPYKNSEKTSWFVMSTVGFIEYLLAWLGFAFGIPLNVILIRLIVRHTPKPMRIYSKILLQTCVTDILLLLITLLFNPNNFVTEKGETAVILYGLVTIKGMENRIWNLLAFICFVFLVYVSMFGYVSQFIFRYFVLVRGKNISTPKYFLLFFLMLLFPFAYCVNLFICYFPPAKHALMDDKSVAEILGINLDEQILLAGYSFNNIHLTIGFYYIITVCSFAYLIIFCLAFFIKKFMGIKSKSISLSASEINKKMIEMNNQVSRNLLIQASMPLFIYLSVIFLIALLIFKIDTQGWKWLQYYNLLSSIPMFLPSVLNPIVSIWVINFYRRVLISDVKRLAKFLNIFHW
ncbi:hypothetical protein niasHT_034285 [Heterodera trifolii]|uniref:G-protein coupled receptors family 1 profile domain-containing protein n=1 Tax=Heterodera trifolii TaxID=157864 RepID=A0ABD2HW54_9BILA